RIVDANRAFFGAADDVLVEKKGKDGARVRAADERERRAARPARHGEPARLEHKRRENRGDFFVVLVERARPPRRRTRISHETPPPHCASIDPPHERPPWKTPDVPRNLSTLGITRTWSPKGLSRLPTRKRITTNSRKVMKSYEGSMIPEATTSWSTTSRSI